MRLPIAAITAMLLLAQPALAQSTSSDNKEVTGSEPEQNTTQVQQARIERTLQGAGFTNIEMTPTAFLVRAKNRDGKPVLMVVDPISMTASIVENGQSAPPDITTGSASPK